MTIDYAVDRLYETGWSATGAMETDRLPNGLRYPRVSQVQREFADAGVELSIKPHLMFGCWRAEWTGSDFTGTVVGSCEQEAAVYALAKLREQKAELQLAAV
jgi:hypothetical protein